MSRNVYLLCPIIASSGSLCRPDPLKIRALDELLKTLAAGQEFVKVHAAEYLIATGHIREAKEEFLKENELHGDRPKYRIGIWRVLSQTGSGSADRTKWNNKIFAAFADLAGSDRLHAAETLAKLRLSPLERYPEATQSALRSESRNLQVYTLWASSYSSKETLEKSRQQFLDIASSDPSEDIRRIAAFILRRIKGLSRFQWSDLAELALSEPTGSDIRSSLLSTAFVTFPEEAAETARYLRIREEMLKGPRHFSAGKRIEVALALAEGGTVDDLPLLASWLNDEYSEGIYEIAGSVGADVRATAAFAILKIKQNVGETK